MDNIGDIIRVLRERKNLNQVQLAQRLGVSKQTLNSYEKSHRNPPADVIRKLTKELNTSADVLFGLANKKMVDLSHLSEEQIKAVVHVISVIEDGNKN